VLIERLPNERFDDRELDGNPLSTDVPRPALSTIGASLAVNRSISRHRELHQFINAMHVEILHNPMSIAERDYADMENHQKGDGSRFC
jgi:hypothetical protein